MGLQVISWYVRLSVSYDILNVYTKRSWSPKPSGLRMKERRKECGVITSQLLKTEDEHFHLRGAYLSFKVSIVSAQTS